MTDLVVNGLHVHLGVEGARYPGHVGARWEFVVLESNLHVVSHNVWHGPSADTPDTARVARVHGPVEALQHWRRRTGRRHPFLDYEPLVERVPTAVL